MISSQLSSGARKLFAVRHFRQSMRKFSDYHGVPEHYKHMQRLNMNEGYPVPKELYADAYARRQSTYNKMLGFSVLLLVSAITFITTQETFSFLSAPPRKVLNWE